MALDLRNMTLAMMEHMRPRVSAAERIRMDNELSERQFIVALDLGDLVNTLWPEGRHANTSKYRGINAGHRDFVSRNYSTLSKYCEVCMYKPRHLAS